MRKTVLMFTALLLFGAALAHAQGSVNLAWNNCITQGTAAADKTYACDGSSNGVPFRLVMSVTPDVNVPNFVGAVGVLDVRTQGLTTLPDWWKLGVGECRDGNLAFPGALTGIGTGATGACQNPYLGSGTGGGYQWDSETSPDGPRPGWGRVRTAVARTDDFAMVAGQMYVAGNITLDTFNDIDSGTGVCNGCSTPACLVLNEVVVGVSVGLDLSATTPGTRNYVTWQGGSIGGNGCPLEVPVRNVTWGSIKAIYR